MYFELHRQNSYLKGAIKDILATCKADYFSDKDIRSRIETTCERLLKDTEE